MTYIDPRSGQERNLGQDNVSSGGYWLSAFVVICALAFAGWYFYDHSQTTADINKPPPAASVSSAPPAPTTGQNNPANEKSDGSSTGSSTGTSGSNGTAQ